MGRVIRHASAQPKTSLSRWSDRCSPSEGASCRAPNNAPVGSAVGFGGQLGQTLSSAADRLDVAVIEVADLGAVLEQDAITLPVETVGKNDLALRADRDAMDLCGAAHLVVHLQLDLTGVRCRELVGLPVLHHTQSARKRA